MSASPLDLSIAIVSWNTRDLLRRCLQTIFETAGDLALEVIVVDNASSDGSPVMVHEQFPQVRLLENNDNRGFACANNQAIALSRGRYVLLLNSDTEVQPAALRLLIDALDTQPQAGAAGPMMLNLDGTPQNSYGDLPSVLAEIIGPYLFDFINKPWGILGRHQSSRRNDQRKVSQTDRVSFACTLIRRATLEQVGVLDESFIFYSEDYDWFKRAKDAGWDVLFCPEPRVKHHWGASSSQKSDWSLRQLYNSKRVYFAKHYGRAAESGLRLGLMVRFMLKWLLAFITFPLQPERSRQQARSQAKLMRVMLAPAERQPHKPSAPA